MATILPFVVRPRGPAPARAEGHAATIIIFPGVRYESVGEGGRQNPPEAADGARRRRKGKAR